MSNNKSSLNNIIASIILGLSAIILISLLWIWVIKIPKTDRIPGKITIELHSDSTLVMSAEDRTVIIDSLNTIMQRREQLLANKYQYVIEKRAIEDSLFSIGSILVGIIIAILGFFGFKSFQTIEEKAHQIAKETAKTTAKETAKSAAKETAKTTAKETAKSAAKETAKTTAKETAKSTAEEVAKIESQNYLNKYIRSNVNSAIQENFLAEIKNSIAESLKSDIIDQLREEIPEFISHLDIQNVSKEKMEEEAQSNDAPTIVTPEDKIENPFESEE